MFDPFVLSEDQNEKCELLIQKLIHHILCREGTLYNTNSSCQFANSMRNFKKLEISISKVSEFILNNYLDCQAA